MTNERRVPHVVVDTNIAVSSLLNQYGNPSKLFAAWQRGAVALITSADLVAEVERVLHKPRIRRKYPITDEQIQGFVATLLAGAEQATPVTPLPLASRDPKDDMFLAVALGGTADYLITGDEDLLILDGAPEARRSSAPCALSRCVRSSIS